MNKYPTIKSDRHRRFLKTMIRVDDILTRLDFYRTADDPESLTAIAKNELESLLGGFVVFRLFGELREYKSDFPYVDLYMREIINGLRRAREIAEGKF